MKCHVTGSATDAHRPGIQAAANMEDVRHVDGHMDMICFETAPNIPYLP